MVMNIKRQDYQIPEKYLNLNGDDKSVVRKRCHSTIYHTEVKRLTDLGKPKISAQKSARVLAKAVILIWATLVKP